MILLVEEFCPVGELVSAIMVRDSRLKAQIPTVLSCHTLREETSALEYCIPLKIHENLFLQIWHISNLRALKFHESRVSGGHIFQVRFFFSECSRITPYKNATVSRRRLS